MKSLIVVVATAITLSGIARAETPAASAPSAAESGQAAMPQEKLDALLAPIALYPDQLLMQALIASTYPLDVVAAARFVKENKDLKGAALDKAVLQKKWDPSVQSLTAYPQVLEMMNNNLEWTQELGDAFLSDEKRVMQTVQNLRTKAEAAGNLKSSEQMKVVKEGSTIIIEPAQPQVIYVPTYDPMVIYGAWTAVAYPPYYYPPPPYYYPPGAVVTAGLIGFGLGVAYADNHWDWSHADWHGGNVDIDINQNNTFINNHQDFKNKINNGQWQHNPSQRKGVAYRDAATRDQFRRVDANAVSARREARGFEPAARGAGTRGLKQSGIAERGGGRAPDARPSFDAGQSRQQARNLSERGASSRASMAAQRGSPGGGGGRSFGGGRGGRR